MPVFLTVPVYFVVLPTETYSPGQQFESRRDHGPKTIFLTLVIDFADVLEINGMPERQRLTETYDDYDGQGRDSTAGFRICADVCVFLTGQKNETTMNRSGNECSDSKIRLL